MFFGNIPVSTSYLLFNTSSLSNNYWNTGVASLKVKTDRAACSSKSKVFNRLKLIGLILM